MATAMVTGAGIPALPLAAPFSMALGSGGFRFGFKLCAVDLELAQWAGDGDACAEGVGDRVATSPVVGSVATGAFAKTFIAKTFIAKTFIALPV